MPLLCRDLDALVTFLLSDFPAFMGTQRAVAQKEQSTAMPLEFWHCPPDTQNPAKPHKHITKKCLLGNKQTDFNQNAAMFLPLSRSLMKCTKSLISSLLFGKGQQSPRSQLPTSMSCSLLKCGTLKRVSLVDAQVVV